MERFFKYVLPLLISVVAAMEFYQVLMRYVFELPVMGLDELLIYPTLWLYLLGSVNAAREDTQIKANVLDVFLKTEKSRLVVRVIADIMSVTVSCWLTYWAWDYFKYARRVWKESPTLYIPTFWAECSLFIGLTLMTAYSGYYLLKNARRLFSQAPLQPAEPLLQPTKEL
ncbi:TRAP transporter small permease [Desulfopila sp. IMCC35008]|uniref:TRAP transporter small permease n=1 Tax=Desulfopila sp. IMCC35008 TaxID=2653858 RepID=UPI0013D3E711|nr:TRAP transporter small permease subunit [Desulfopila sp. IMCC35008]